MKIKNLLLVLVGLAAGFWARGWWTEKTEGIKVIGVIDGDTIVTENKVRVRLRYLDAPELKFCGGQEAKEALESLVVGKRVKIKEKIIDQHGRPMALVYRGSILVNEEMLRSGWAKYHSDTTDLTEQIKQTANEAKEKELGIFSQKCSQKVNLDKPECNIKGNIDPNDASVKIYHLPGCVQYETTVVELYRGEEWFCSQAEAKKAGYVKSKRCP